MLERELQCPAPRSPPKRASKEQLTPSPSCNRLSFSLVSLSSLPLLFRYAAAPPGMRIWCGATVEREDVRALMPWIHYYYHRAQEQSV